MKENVIIPESGLISLGYMSELTWVSVDRLTQTMTDYGVPFLKLGGYHRDWYVSLRKVADIAHGGGGNDR